MWSIAEMAPTFVYIWKHKKITTNSSLEYKMCLSSMKSLGVHQEESLSHSSQGHQKSFFERAVKHFTYFLSQLPQQRYCGLTICIQNSLKKFTPEITVRGPKTNRAVFIGTVRAHTTCLSRSPFIFSTKHPGRTMPEIILSLTWVNMKEN